MQFLKSVVLLAALSSSAVAHADGHAHRHAHKARGFSTVTLTTSIYKTVCPCESTTSSSSYVAPTTTSTTTSTTMLEHSTTSTSTSEYTPTSTPEATTSVIPTTTTSAAATTTSSGAGADWTSTPSDGTYSTSGFGGITEGYNLTSGDYDTYVGNLGSPYGSNIQEVSASDASSYKYVVQFTGSNSVDWTVKIWNKIGPDHKMDGWFSNACHSFTLAAGETRYWAFDENSQGGWAAAEGSSIPLDTSGQYAATWGEYNFGDQNTSDGSSWDVSAITANDAGKTIQGMRICGATRTEKCSSVSAGGSSVKAAYLANPDDAGLGPYLTPGPVRLAVEIDYQG